MVQREDPVNFAGIQKVLSQNAIKPKSQSSASFEDPNFMELEAKSTLQLSYSDFCECVSLIALI